MKKITYYLRGHAYEYIPNVRVMMYKNHDDPQYFWTLERYPDKFRKFKGKADWRIREKYVSRARRACYWRRSERFLPLVPVKPSKRADFHID